MKSVRTQVILVAMLAALPLPKVMSTPSSNVRGANAEDWKIAPDYD